MPYQNRQESGYTVVELLVALALVALMMTAAALALQATESSRTYNREKIDLVARVRGVADRIARDVRLASSIEVPDSATLAITMADGTIRTYQWDGAPGGNLTFTLTDGDTNPSSVLTDGVDSFVVTDDNPACTVSITIGGQLTSAEITITATPRKSVF